MRVVITKHADGTMSAIIKRRGAGRKSVHVATGRLPADLKVQVRSEVAKLPEKATPAQGG